MKNGLVLTIPNSDFSSNNTGNALFPCYQNLKQAIFYGNKIPNLTAFKKIKGVNKSALGTASFTDYTVKLAQSDYFPKVIDKLPNGSSTIALVLSRASAPNKNNTLYLIANSGATNASEAGGFILEIYETSDGLNTTMQLFPFSIGVNSALRASAAGISPYFIAIATFNIATKEVTFTVANANGQQTKSVIAGNLLANGNLYNTDTEFRFNETMPGGLHYSAVSVHDKALNAAEIQQLIDYYKSFYADAPVPV